MLVGVEHLGSDATDLDHQVPAVGRQPAGVVLRAQSVRRPVGLEERVAVAAAVERVLVGVDEVDGVTGDLGDSGECIGMQHVARIHEGQELAAGALDRARALRCRIAVWAAFDELSVEIPLAVDRLAGGGRAHAVVASDEDDREARGVAVTPGVRGTHGDDARPIPEGARTARPAAPDR